MDVLAPVRSIDRFQRRHRTAAIGYAVVKKFGDDGAGNAAALIAYFGFFSLFPLLLLFVTILGFVLQGDPSAQHAVLNSALKQFPVVGSSLSDTHSLRGSPLALVVGAVGALLSGLGVTLAAENAFNVVYAVPHKERPNFLTGRIRGLKFLLIFGVLQVVSTGVSGVVSGGFGGVVLTILGILISVLLNVVLFYAVFRLLTTSDVPTRQLWPGILIASVLWEVLQVGGGAYIGHVIKGAGQTYGTFATVIGLLVWLYLGARVVVYCAEINTVLTRELWPRSILAPPTRADRRARAALAKVEERDHSQTVDVSFHRDVEQRVDPAHVPYTVTPAPAGVDAADIKAGSARSADRLPARATVVADRSATQRPGRGGVAVLASAALSLAVLVAARVRRSRRPG